MVVVWEQEGMDVDGLQVIQFAHFSVKEYLTLGRVSQAKDTISQFHVSMTSAHTLIGRAGLRSTTY